MKQFLLTNLIALCCCTLSAERYYVMPEAEAEGDGATWESALPSFQAALEIVQEGDEIWLAAGTYLPTSDNDRTVAFAIPSGVMVYGGFAGTEEHLEDRNWEENVTILSGEIGDTESEEDNSFTIVSFNLADSNTVLDGVTLTKGVANGYEDGADLSTCGAAIFNNGEFGESSPQLRNCTFLYNYSREGAAIYNYANEGIASPIISDCKFFYNRSDFNGGAIFNNGDFGLCNPNILNCHFEGNESSYGAGVINTGSYGECKPTLADCRFYNNFAITRGSGVYDLREGRGTCESQLIGCTFEENQSTVGSVVDTTTQSADEKSSSTKRSSGIQLRTSEDSAISY